MPIPDALKFTYDDYLNFPNDGKRHEIVDGEHYMTPSPQTRHQIVSRNLETVLAIYVQENEWGQIFDAPMDVLLSDATVVQPDLLFIRKERENIIKKNFIEGPPDLIVEILSPGGERLDRQTKMKNYALLGVPEYWIVDYEARILEQFVLRGQLYERAGVFTDAFSPALFPGLTIDLRSVFKGPGF
jgi:Uma2 family endonuclease